MKVALKEYNEIMGCMENAYHEAVLKMHLSDSEMDILYILSAYPEGCNQSTIYKESWLTKSTANSALKKMEKSGFLCIEPGDGRNTRVFLTPSGKKLMEQTAYQVIQIENEIYEEWTEEEQETFLRLNREFADKLKEKVDRL